MPSHSLIGKIEIYDERSNAHLFSLSNVPQSETIQELKARIHAIRPKLYESRQRLKKHGSKAALSNSSLLSSVLTADDGDCLLLSLKDLGPQISWRGVFVVEYLGPLLIYALVYQHNWSTATRRVHIASCCWSFHYAKRIYESMFIHKFSQQTMPLRNLFKNCSYYWGFAGWIAYLVNHPQYTQSAFPATVAVFLFLVAEIGNLQIHLALSNLRPENTTERKIPMPLNALPFTYLFNYVSCANYTYEIMAWLSFFLLTQCLAVLVFAIAGAVQMSIWATQKQRRYLNEFGDKYKKLNRKAIIPFVL